MHKFIRKNIFCYSQNAIGPYLYSVEFTLTKFGKDPTYASLFQEALDFVIEQTSQVLASPANCERSPELVNDFFGMTLRYLRYNDFIFFNSSQLENLTMILVHGAGVNSQLVAESHVRILKELLKVLNKDLVNID